MENVMMVRRREARFSIPSILALVLALLSFFVGSGWGIVLALGAIALGVIGFVMALAPGVRGGVISVLSMLAGGLGALVAVIKLIVPG